MNRGRRSEAIFSEKEDFQIFIALLEETAEMWNIRISAYCLMPNHYHLLLQTPAGNISRGMRLSLAKIRSDENKAKESSTIG
jgi:REP element-mobilizing transposase RayT